MANLAPPPAAGAAEAVGEGAAVGVADGLVDGVAAGAPPLSELDATISIAVVPYTPEPSAAAALTVTIPAEIPVNNPPALIIAVPVPFSIDHTMLWFVASAGTTA